MSALLVIAPALLDDIRAAAKRAHPNECCGLIEGVHTGRAWHAHALHEAHNVAEDREKNFLIDPAAHLRLLGELRSTDREIIGCYHSHPTGLPKPSETDRREAVDDGFVWVIVKGDDVKAYVFNDSTRSFSPLTIA